MKVDTFKRKNGYRKAEMKCCATCKFAGFSMGNYIDCCLVQEDGNAFAFETDGVCNKYAKREEEE